MSRIEPTTGLGNAAARRTVAAIEIRDVQKRFEGRGSQGPYTALEGVNLVVEEGQFLCLLGPSGCGKSTLLHLIAGFDRPTGGEVLFRGEPIAGPGAERAVVFQSELAVFTWLTVEGNVEYGLRVRGVRRAERASAVCEALELVGLAPHRTKLPRELSGGMKQRVQIARVLANDPDCLLMDEPFGALDAQTRMRLQDELVGIWEKTHKTVVFVTHDVTEAVYLADRIAVMSEGPAGRIKQVVDVNIPRPRDRSAEPAVALVQRLTEELHRTEVTDDRA